MEQHPVPRNISSFQFHLIGDMTLRQFLYLAAGGLIAFIIYKTPLPDVFKYLFIFLSGFFGVAFAFLPIQERPLDRWLIAFLRSIFSPTQYLWHKEGIALDILTSPAVIHVQKLSPTHAQAHQDARFKLNAYLKTLPVVPSQTINIREKNYLDKTLSLFGAGPTVVRNIPAVKLATVSKPAVTAQSQPPQIPSSPAVNNPSPVLQQQLNTLAQEKISLEKELIKLREEMKKLNEPRVVKPGEAVEVKKPTIKSVTAQAAVDEIGLSKLPEAPNIIFGIVKDSQNKFIPNIIITIKDSKGMPIRALKTNKLGQFVTATSLPNGTYYLEIEDPLKRYVFDIAQIALSGKIFLPIEIKAKGEKELMREKLTKEIFGNPRI